MKLYHIFTNVSRLIKSNAPEILTAVSICGVGTTAYLTAKASFEAARMIDWDETMEGYNPDAKERFKERAKNAWPLYVPPAIAGVATIGAIILSSRVSAKRTGAAVAAYSILDKGFSEYREKVVEQIGKGKEQKIRDEIAQDKINYNPLSREVIVIGGGNVLCCELLTGRYFRSDMEILRKAQNDINARIVSQMYVSLEEFYDLIGLSNTTHSDRQGWDSDKLMEMQFTTALSANGEPCLAFEYNYVKPLR